MSVRNNSYCEVHYLQLDWKNLENFLSILTPSIINRLKKENREVIRGDLVVIMSMIKEMILIFDGKKLLPLQNTFGILSIPKSINPIEENLPVDYWSDPSNDLQISTLLWIQMKTILDGLLTPSRQQSIKIGHYFNDEKYAMWIDFIHQGQMYAIICLYQYSLALSTTMNPKTYEIYNQKSSRCNCGKIICALRRGNNLISTIKAMFLEKLFSKGSTIPVERTNPYYKYKPHTFYITL